MINHEKINSFFDGNNLIVDTDINNIKKSYHFSKSDLNNLLKIPNSNIQLDERIKKDFVIKSSKKSKKNKEKKDKKNKDKKDKKHTKKNNKSKS
jgi:hypothetical protein